MNTGRRITLFLMTAALLFSTNGFAGTSDESKTLTIGSSAPELNIEHWISNRNDDFKQVTQFETGKVYVIEFWATWCGPCIASMPHISKLQDKFADKGVQIISISDEEVETVQSFLEKQVRGANDEQTYEQLTANYCLTTDPDGSVQEDYLRASGQNGIPTSFIVGKSGYVEWIGHPMELDEPLSQVVAGSWNREAALKAYQAKQQLQEAMTQIERLARTGEFDKAVALVEKTIKTLPESDQRLQLKNIRLQMYLQLENSAKSVIAFRDLASDAKETPELLNMISWGIVEAHINGAEIGSALINEARMAVDRAVHQEPNNASILDTQAHLAHLQGNLDEAISIQTTAVKNAEPEIRQELKAYLAELQREKNGER